MSELKILLVDNYDSFTYNLVHEIGRVRPDALIDVVQNDIVEPAQSVNYNCVILSPGPGVPEESGKLLDVIRFASGKVPILGVCLGLQALNVATGGKLRNLQKVYHGVSSQIILTPNESVLFNGMSKTFLAGRYHSWVIDESTLDDSFSVTARDDEGNIMAVENREHNIFGVQFHPESIMTPEGKFILNNFLKMV
jgi:anthranilate synthase component 2